MSSQQSAVKALAIAWGLALFIGGIAFIEIGLFHKWQAALQYIALVPGFVLSMALLAIAHNIHRAVFGGPLVNDFFTVLLWASLLAYWLVVVWLHFRVLSAKSLRAFHVLVGILFFPSMFFPFLAGLFMAF